MDNATKPPLTPEELRVLGKKMLVGQTITVFFRLSQPDASIPAAKYTSVMYTVDVSMPKTVVNAAEDEYVWLSPEDRPHESEPFPEDGRHGCDLYEYSYVDISGDPEPEEPAKSRRVRPSQRGSSEGSTKSGSEVRERVRADTREVAEDCARWPEVLCTGNEALDTVNLIGLIAYYEKTFGHLGGGGDLKKHIGNLLTTLSSDMEAVASRPDLPNSKSWVRARHLVISELDGYRSTALGFSAAFVRETKLAYQGDTIPVWQREAHAQAIGRMKLQTSGVDVRTLGQKKETREAPRRSPPAQRPVQKEKPEEKGPSGTHTEAGASVASRQSPGEGGEC